jgi:hypothetical protein
MQDSTPKKSGPNLAVNECIRDLAAWDHKPGDPERPDWHDPRTGADVRLDDVNQPSSYERLKDEEKAAIQEWIARKLRPATTKGPENGLRLREICQYTGCFYVTNGQFKGAMLVGGYEPIDRTELNWSWCYEFVDPELPAKSLANARGVGRVA